MCNRISTFYRPQTSQFHSDTTNTSFDLAKVGTFLEDKTRNSWTLHHRRIRVRKGSTKQRFSAQIQQNKNHFERGCETKTTQSGEKVDYHEGAEGQIWFAAHGQEMQSLDVLTPEGHNRRHNNSASEPKLLSDGFKMM